jgi:hypothetical protein
LRRFSFNSITGFCFSQSGGIDKKEVILDNARCGAVTSMRRFLENAEGNKMMKYKGYVGIVEYDDKAKIFQ